mmetsp:Transcript_43258/g.123756  ORF Transcript_43258/g.123756 Transcript_43258/m.123756 type:complete len:328 (-) Transcript_43258:225-1208(-)
MRHRGGLQLLRGAVEDGPVLGQQSSAAGRDRKSGARPLATLRQVRGRRRRRRRRRGGRRRALLRHRALRALRPRALLREPGPIEDPIHTCALPGERLHDQRSETGVVRPVLKAEAPAIVQVRRELGREIPAELFWRRIHLLPQDLLVLVPLGARLQALPRQLALQKVHHEVADGLQIVTSALLHTQVSVHARVSRRTCQGLVLLVWNVLMRLRVAILLGQAEVNDVHLVSLGANADEEVVGLDVSMNDVPGVHVLQAANHLVGEHHGRLQCEPPVAHVEQVLKGGPEEINHHGIVLPLDAVPVHVRDADAAGQHPVHLGLVQQLRCP